MNTKGKYENFACKMYEIEDETQKHIIECPVINKERTGAWHCSAQACLSFSKGNFTLNLSLRGWKGAWKQTFPSSHFFLIDPPVNRK